MSTIFDEALRQGLRASIERDDRELRFALQQLGATVRAEWDVTRERMDVKRRIVEKPTLYLGVAFCIGVWLGGHGRRLSFRRQFH